jgi:Holliday junction resolvase RusA-like endonuclease
MVWLTVVAIADVDNIVKAVLDAINGIAYEDDADVAVLVASKYNIRAAKKSSR